MLSFDLEFLLYYHLSKHMKKNHGEITANAHAKNFLNLKTWEEIMTAQKITHSQFTAIFLQFLVTISIFQNKIVWWNPKHIPPC